MGLGIRVRDLGCRMLGFRDSGLGFGLQELQSTVQGLGLGCQAQGLDPKNQDSTK